MNVSKFSFIVPVYNCEKYLNTCVISIKKVNLEDYEIILIDDGSIDKSGYICDKLEQENKEVRCIHQENHGVSFARNCGIKQASGDYILFLDADDSIESDKLGRVLRSVESDKKIDLAIYGLSFDYYYHEKCYRRDELAYPVNGCLNKKQWLDVFRDLYSVNAISPVWNKVYRREILVNNQLEFNEDMFIYEDLDFSIRYLACCDMICNFSEIIYHYRQTEDEGNAGRRLKRIENLSYLVKHIEETLNLLYADNTVVISQNLLMDILIPFYLVLANDKIKVSKSKDICKICDDFTVWYSDRNFDMPQQNQVFINQLLKKKIFHLIFNKYYVYLRHKIAVWIKYIKGSH